MVKISVCKHFLEHRNRLQESHSSLAIRIFILTPLYFGRHVCGDRFLFLFDFFWPIGTNWDYLWRKKEDLYDLRVDLYDLRMKCHKKVVTLPRILKNRLKSFEIVWGGLKSFEMVWNRLKWFTRSIKQHVDPSHT